MDPKLTTKLPGTLRSTTPRGVYMVIGCPTNTFCSPRLLESSDQHTGIVELPICSCYSTIVDDTRLVTYFINERQSIARQASEINVQ